MGQGRKIITVTLANAYYDIKIDTRMDFCMQKYKGLKPEATFLNVTSWSSHRFVQEHLCSAADFPLGMSGNPYRPLKGMGRNALHCTFIANFQ